MQPISALLLAASLLTVTPSSANTLPARQHSLLDRNAFSDLGKRRSPKADYHIVRIKGQEFMKAWRIKVRLVPKNPYSIQLSAKISRSIKKGDLLLARFFIRTLKKTGKNAETEFVFERAGGDYRKSIRFPVPASAEWRRIDIPFHSLEDYPAGGANANIRVGFAIQTVEIGGFKLLNFGKNAEINQLPRSRAFYDGKERDAAWRAEALRRISRIRTAKLEVTVLYKGRPAQGAAVQIKMLRHAFTFGSAVNARVLEGSDTDPDVLNYRMNFKNLFNKAVMENALKWTDWEGKGRPYALAALKRLKAWGIPVRGHNLIWPRSNRVPSDVRSLLDDPTALRRRIRHHIRDEASALKGQVVEWDVINEPSDAGNLMGTVGNWTLPRWIEAARKGDPTARLFVNETGILSQSHRGSRRRRRFDEVVSRILQNKPPLYGIGLQSHFDWLLTPPEILLKRLDRLSQYKLPIMATEFDIDINDEDLQADYMRDFMVALFSHPSVEGIMIWGFWEGRHSSPNAALFRNNWSLRPAGRMWLDLVHRRWWTDVRRESAADGKAMAHGYLGDYEVIVDWKGKRVKRRVQLTRAGAAVKISF